MENIDYFFALAEEESITKAANRMCITQQSMSSYLKSLEASYHTTLFYRRPYLHLTNSGKKLLFAYQQIRIIQENVSENLCGNNKLQSGSITIGIPSGRVRQILPGILPSFSKSYPNVSIKIEQSVSAIFVQQLLKGQIDLFIGTTPILSPYIQNELLAEESVFLVVSDILLQRSFPSRYPECILDFKKGIEFEDMRKLPISCSAGDSEVRHHFIRFAAIQNTDFRFLLECGGTDIRLDLCRQDYCACICTEFYVRSLLEDINNGKLFAFPIKGFNKKIPRIVAWRKDIVQPAYIEKMIDLILKSFRNKE